jgi:xanthine dehydrogenase accessory factor
VEKVVNEFPVDEVDKQPVGSYFIVMTHNHQLDQELSEAILKRNDFKYFGLIGSLTKRNKFIHRLQAKGFSSEQIERMTCPMGIAAVKGKLPAEIAVSVAGEVIAHYNADVNAERKTTSTSATATSVVDRLAI